MSLLDEETGTLIKGLINGALHRTAVNGSIALDKAKAPIKTGPNARPNLRKIRDAALKIKESLEQKIRVPQSRTPAEDKDVGDDTEPFVPEKDEVNLRRRKSYKRFINSIDE